MDISRGKRTMAAAMLLLAVQGCALGGIYVHPPSPETRTGTKLVVLTPIQTIAPPDAPKTPAKGMGRGIMLGAGEGASAPLAVADALCWVGGEACIVGLAFGIVFAPVGAIVGAVAGAANSHSSEEVEKSEASLRAALSSARTSAALREAVIAAGREKTRLTFEGRGEKDAASLEALSAITILDLEIEEFRVLTSGRIEPDVQLCIIVKATAHYGGKETYWRRWMYRGFTRGYFKAARNNAALLKSDLRAANVTLAHRIVTDLFVTSEPESVHRRPPRHEPNSVLSLDGSNTSVSKHKTGMRKPRRWLPRRCRP